MLLAGHGWRRGIGSGRSGRIFMKWDVEGYQTLAELGNGSAGTVVSARDKLTAAIVAIRYLSQELSDSPYFMAGLRREVSLLDVVEHANLGLVYELVEQGGRAALVTQLVDGPSLRTILAHGGALPPEAALYVTAELLAGLVEVHARGIVHRAIKPEAVLVDPSGVVKLVDVGLATPARNGVPAHPLYAAPELWQGGEASVASDIFAASAVLFESVTGQLSRGTEVAVRPELVPEPLRLLVGVGLAPQPQGRHPDARTALDRLRSVAQASYGPRWYETGRELFARRKSAAQAAAADAAPPARTVAAAPPRTLTPELPLPARPVGQSLGPAVPAPAAGRAAPMSPAAARGAVPMAPAAATLVVPVAEPAVRPVPPLRPSQPTSPSPSGATTSWAAAAPAAVATPAWAGPPAATDTSDRTQSWTTLLPVQEPAPAGSGTPATPPPGPRRRTRTARIVRILVAAAVLAILGAGTAFAVNSALSPAGPSPSAVTTNSHAPLVLPGPTVPVPAPGVGPPGADTLVPATPAGLHVTGRSVNAVSLDWAEAMDNVKVAGYIVVRDGKRAGTTFTPGFTDSGLMPQTKHHYAVAAFDAAGNISPNSTPVSATTLTEPDVSPPTIPTNLHATGKSVTSIVLAWTVSHDNVGVAGYEVYRDGKLVANVPQPGFTDVGLAAASTHTYTVRAYDTSNNASADSDGATVTTLTAPDTTPPSTPGQVDAQATSSTTIDVHWAPSTDNVGVTKYQVYRDGALVAEVAGTSFTDQGLNPSTSYDYAVRALDAAGNPSGMSGTASASTPAAPTTPPPTPDPTTDPPTTDPAPEIVSVTLAVSETFDDCVVTLQATVSASAPMDATLTYDITGIGGGSDPLHFTSGNLTQTVTLPQPDAGIDGTATAQAGGVAANPPAGWVQCTITPPTTDGT
jgi:serine/threonine protein kinase/chitodextrinase